jgi:hypothetical protein
MSAFLGVTGQRGSPAGPVSGAVSRIGRGVEGRIAGHAASGIGERLRERHGDALMIPETNASYRQTSFRDHESGILNRHRADTAGR